MAPPKHSRFRMFRLRWLILGVVVVYVATITYLEWKWSEFRLRGLYEPEVRELFGHPVWDSRKDGVSTATQPADSGFEIVYFNDSGTHTSIVFNNDGKVDRIVESRK